MTHGPSDFDYDKLDNGRGLIAWLMIAMATIAFIVICWLLYEVTKAEPYAAIGREIQSVRSTPCRAGFAEHPDGSCWRLAGDVEVIGE